MFLKLRYYYRLVTAFLGKFKFILLLGIIIGILIFIAAQYFERFATGINTQRIGYVGRYRPDDLPDYVLYDIGDGLTSINEEGEVEPSIAKSWETTDKGKTWVFALTDDMKWQDDKDIKSEDINYDFSDVKIEKPDENTIIFNLEEPFTPFPYIVSKPVFKKGLLGTGAWKVDDILISNGYVQEIKISNSEGGKKVIKFFPTEDEAKLAYKLGRIDTIEELIDPSPFGSWTNTSSDKKIESDSIITLFFNTEDQLISSKPVRQALIYGIDKESMLGERAISPISKDSWAYNPQVKPYVYDTERAKDLLSDIPEEQMKDGIKLVTTPSLLEAADKIASYWNSIGMPTTVLVSSVLPDDFQVFLTIFELPKDPDQYSIWHSTQEVTNISNYKDPRIDKLLEDGRTELVKEERKKIYLDFQRFLVEDSPAAFLYYPNIYSISRK